MNFQFQWKYSYETVGDLSQRRVQAEIAVHRL